MKELGVLCHITSLKSDYGVGDFGRSARDFIDFLSENNVSIWQILPLNETNEYNCPYASTCYFSFDEMFVDPDQLLADGKIREEDLVWLKKSMNFKKVNYQLCKHEKRQLLEKAYSYLDEYTKNRVEEYSQTHSWIKDYAYYKTLLEYHNTRDWRDIEKEYWNRLSPESIKFTKKNIDTINKYVYFQYLLDHQWQALRSYAKLKNVKIMGDLPIYPAPNSFDVCNSIENYQVDRETLLPIVFGGVPKDDFSVTGQNWETCIYDWDNLKKNKYKYLIEKIQLMLDRYDILRLDHFLGYTEHYEINASKISTGKWIKAGGEEFFTALFKKVDKSRIVVEDLGVNKPEANKVKKKFDLIGMSVLQLGLGGKLNNKYLPHNVDSDSIYYLNTHDNNTYIGYLKSLSRAEKNEVCVMLDIKKQNDKKMLVSTIKKMLSSASDVVILQVQDLLMQGEKFRMNTPGVQANCWEYRVPKNYKQKVLSTLNLIKNNTQN